MDWNERTLTILVQQLVKMNCRSLTNFNVNRDYVIAVMFHIEVLLFLYATSAALHRIVCASRAAGAVANALLPDTNVHL